MGVEDIFIVSPDKNIDEETEKLFRYWRDKGFPDYDRNDYDIKEEMDKLIKFDESVIYDDKYLRQTMHSCGFLWTYFPNWIDVCYLDSNKSVRSCWDDDNLLRSCIKKTYNWQLKHGNGVFTVNRIRQLSKVYCSSQSVSNFRPTVAKYIYNNFGNNGIVWDMSGGWGGRMMGFLASNCQKYIATEPCFETWLGLQELSSDYEYLGKSVEVHKCGSEDFVLPKNSVDLCFTSPPYFDTEKYSKEPSQSYIKYPSVDEWTNDFLLKTITNCFDCLKCGGYMIINIANTTKYKNIETSLVSMCEKIGFALEDEYKLILSSISGKGIKTEPVFIFRKGI